MFFFVPRQKIDFIFFHLFIWALFILCFALNSMVLHRNHYYTSSSRIYYTHLIHRAWSNILQTVHVHTNFMHIYISFTLTLALQPSYNILLSDLGPLNLRIPQFPHELLVRDPLLEDRPATVRSNLKKGSIYTPRKPSRFTQRFFVTCITSMEDRTSRTFQ